MLDEINYEVLSDDIINTSYGKGGAELGMGVITAFCIVSIIAVVVYKIYGARTGDISLPGGFKFKFTT